MPLNKSDVNDCLALAVAVFPQFPLERSLIDGYYELLSDLDCSKAELFDALKAVLKSSSWFPTVALIREEVLRKPTNQPPQYDPKEFENSDKANPEAVARILAQFKPKEILI